MKNGQNYEEWKVELIAICRAEIPMFDDYDKQCYFTDAFYCDPRMWEGGGDDYETMTPREYFNAHRAEIESYMRGFRLKTPEELEAMNKAFDSAVRQARMRGMIARGA